MSAVKVKLCLCVAVLLALGMALSSGGAAIGTAPIPDVGFRVLITYPDATRDQLPAAQKTMLASTTLRAYLDTHCVKDTNGIPEWRIWSDDQNPANESAIWQKLMPLAKGKGLWVVAGDGTHGVNQAAPADEATLIALLASAGGGK